MLRSSPGAEVAVVAAIVVQPAIGARLGDILVAWGHLTRRQLEWALEEQARRPELLGAVLLRNGVIRPDTLLAARAAQNGLAHLGDAELLAAEIPPEVLARIPRPDAERLGVLPLELEDDGTLWVASSEPGERDTARLLKALARVNRVKFVLVHDPVLRLAFESAYARCDA